MQNLFDLSNKLIRSVKNDFHRSLFLKVDWQQRLIEIKGSRGVGKTTLMLQKASEYHKINPESVIYISLDDTYFFNHTITETAEQFRKYGGKYMFIDEVHKYPPKFKNHDWSAELKNIYDLLPDLKIVYTGSSIIELYKGDGDLSRRKNTYNLNGLSFREFLMYNNLFNFPVFSLDDIINKNAQISSEISSKIKILPHFKAYILHGYFPFYNESPEQYYQRLKNIINVIIDIDISSIPDINFEISGKIKKLLGALASTVPYTPNLTNLSGNLYISDLRTLYKYLNYLEKSELITLLNSQSKGNKILQKPEKIFLNNTNLIYTLVGNKIETGTIRETFFCNQLNYMHKINYPKSGDFIVDDNYVFEIGGKNKTTRQIKEIKHSYIAMDEAETGFANKIPLWLFGFLY